MTLISMVIILIAVPLLRNRRRCCSLRCVMIPTPLVSRVAVPTVKKFPLKGRMKRVGRNVLGRKAHSKVKDVVPTR